MMDKLEELVAQFEVHRPLLQRVAYRMLGSLSEADDAVQESWLRFSRADTSEVNNLSGWLTTVVARICLDMLRLRAARREDLLGVHLPDPLLSREDGLDPEHEMLLNEAVGLALQVVLEKLTPVERIAFVLHDVFAVPFEAIAKIIERSPAATRQLASRARHRVQGSVPVPDPDLERQREVVDAFVAAAHAGDFTALLALLDPRVILRADQGVAALNASSEFRGAKAVSEQALAFAGLAQFAQPILVNGTPGLLVAPHGQVFSIMAFTVTGGKIVEIYILADPARLRQFDLALLND